MVRINILKGKLVEQGKNVNQLANAIGVDRSTIYRWFADPDMISVGTVKKIGQFLELDEDTMRRIFFAA